MGDIEIDALVREQRQVQRVPRDRRCTVCREGRHVSRTPNGRILCYGCLAKESGRSSIERDHVAGRSNLGGLLVDLRASDHRTVTELRRRLGTDRWPESNGDPLLTLAHVLTGLASLLFLFGEWLVALAGDLDDRFGPGWWNGAPPFPVVA